MSTLPPAIEALFDHYFNQTITPEGMAQLEAWLAEDQANAELLARAGLAHGLTREVVKRKMQSNLRPRVLHFAKPVLLAASVLLVVGVGVYLSKTEQMKVAPTVAITENTPAIQVFGSFDVDTPRTPSTHYKELREDKLAALKPAPTSAPVAMSEKFGGEYSGSISASPPAPRGVFKTGEGKLTLSGSNTYTGTTTVTGGIQKNPTGFLGHSLGSGQVTTISGAEDQYRGVRYGFRQDGSVYPGSSLITLRGARDYTVDGTAISIDDPELETSQLRATISIPDVGVHAPPPASRDQYAHIYDNKFASPLIQPLSTFSVDVDTAAYANMRRFVSEGQLPPPDAVRIEELLNYFSYDYAPPAVLKPGEAIGEQAPFAAHTEVCACPWNAGHKLVRIGLKGAEVDMSKRPQAHLTFLVDVSGSMNEPDRLPLAKAALVRLLAQLRADDHVSLVVYAGNSGCVLEDAPCSEKAQILGAIDRLSSGGSTAGAQGINQAYEIAQKHFVKGGVNRVILCTDGDFNVGVSDTGSLITLAKEKANPKSGEGVFLSTCGFGRGNLNDHMMEQIADAGNGNYAYIDSLAEAEKVFVKQAGGTLVTIAKDVKLQLEFNPAKVGKYRLIGYENRVLKAEDFNDDTVDAGDIGAGHTVTALYEVEPVGANPYASVEEEIKDLERQVKEIQDFAARARLTAEASAAQKQALDALAARIAQLKTPAPDRSVDPLTYQNERKISDKAQASGELLTLKLRYKSPEAKAEQGTSKLLKFTLKDADTAFESASADTRFAASVAAYGMILRGSEHKGTATLGWVEKAAGGTMPKEAGYGDMVPATTERVAQRTEFITLVRKAAQLKKD